MITLTNPSQVLSVLGGTTKVGYDKFVISPMNIDPVHKRIDAQIFLRSSVVPEMQPIHGNLTVDANTGVLTAAIGQLDFFRQVSLTPGQAASVQAMIDNAQNALESGLVTLNIVAGTQTAGI